MLNYIYCYDVGARTYWLPPDVDETVLLLAFVDETVLLDVDETVLLLALDVRISFS